MKKEQDNKDKQQQKPLEPEQVKDDQAAVGDTIILDKQEYAKLRQDAEKANEYYDRLLRMQAEFDNFRKRMEKDKSEFAKFANESLVQELLIVLDDLERLVSLGETHSNDFKSFLKGVELILAHLYELLKRYNVSSMDTKGKNFDPMIHEALMTTETESDTENKILEEFQKGYFLNNKLLRTAKVRVAKKKEH